MLDELFSSEIGQSLSLGSTLAILGAALALGLIISLVYMQTHKKEGYSSGFAVTLIMLPAIISIIILLVGNNVARAFSLAGAFSLIRFRSAPGDPKDIAYVFFTLGVGLACGMGFIGYGALFAIILCLVMLALERFGYARSKSTAMQLKVTIPENLNFQGLFDDILTKYTTFWTMKNVKTADFGSLFEICYSIKLKQEVNQKVFMDELRCRNGNLKIVLTVKETDDKYQM